MVRESAPHGFQKSNLGGLNNAYADVCNVALGPSDIAREPDRARHGKIDANDPGWVKTCTSQECAELFSLSSSLSSGRKHFWFTNLRNRDGISTRRLNIGVFTRPRPEADSRRIVKNRSDT